MTPPDPISLLDDRDWLERHYVDRQDTLRGIADKLGVTTAAVDDSLHLHGIRRRAVTTPARDHPALHAPCQLAEVTCGRTQEQVASTLGVSVKRVRAAQRRHALTPGSRGSGPT